MLDAARYAAHRAIHQLIPVTAFSSGGITAPITFPIMFSSPELKWIGEDRLPEATHDSKGARPRQRAAYLSLWAERPMVDGLTEVRAFMDTEIGPAVGL